MQANSANAAEAKTALKALGQSFDKTGTLTSDTLNKIRNASQGTALAFRKNIRLPDRQRVQRRIRTTDHA
jgi:hypothetical protein